MVLPANLFIIFLQTNSNTTAIEGVQVFETYEVLNNDPPLPLVCSSTRSFSDEGDQSWDIAEQGPTNLLPPED